MPYFTDILLPEMRHTCRVSVTKTSVSLGPCSVGNSIVSLRKNIPHHSGPVSFLFCNVLILGRHAKITKTTLWLMLPDKICLMPRSSSLCKSILCIKKGPK